jgi:hypothetical protein
MRLAVELLSTTRARGKPPLRFSLLQRQDLRTSHVLISIVTRRWVSESDWKRKKGLLMYSGTVCGEYRIFVGQGDSGFVLHDATLQDALSIHEFNKLNGPT